MQAQRAIYIPAKGSVYERMRRSMVSGGSILHNGERLRIILINPIERSPNGFIHRRALVTSLI